MTDDPEPHIAIDAANVLHNAGRGGRHNLSHLEGEFLAEWRRLATFSETEARRLLAWLAGRL